MAQSPESLNYQAVVRDTDGAIRANQVTSVDFNIRQGAADGTIVYSEMHDPTTNEFGLVNVKVGGGTAATGSFAAINWGAGPYFLEVLLNDVSAGTQEFSSVPFSLYAKNAGSATTAENATSAITAGSANTAATADFATAAGTANDDNDRSPTNEIQTLSINDRTISLSDGGTVTLPENVELWDSRSYAISPADNRSVGIDLGAGVGVELFPNPASDFATLQIETESNLDLRFDLVDISGRLISSQLQGLPASVTSHTIDLSKLPAGTYFVRIATPRGSVLKTLKLVHI
jgi:hypothetical protein